MPLAEGLKALDDIAVWGIGRSDDALAVVRFVQKWMENHRWDDRCEELTNYLRGWIIGNNEIAREKAIEEARKSGWEAGFARGFSCGHAEAEAKR